MKHYRLLKQETVELAQTNLLKTKQQQSSQVLEVEEGAKDLVAPLQRPLQLTEMARQLQQLTEEVKQLRLYQTPSRKTAPRWSSRNRPPPPRVVCWHCGRQGHIQRNCPNSWTEPRNYQNNRANPHPDSVNTIHSPITVNGYFKDIRTSMLVDTGSAVTLVREDLWRACTCSYLLPLEESERALVRTYFLSRSLNVHLFVPTSSQGV